MHATKGFGAFAIFVCFLTKIIDKRINLSVYFGAAFYDNGFQTDAIINILNSMKILDLRLSNKNQSNHCYSPQSSSSMAFRFALFELSFDQINLSNNK